MASSPRNYAQWVASLLLLGALVVGAFFAGLGSHFVLLFGVSGLLLTAISLLATNALPEAAVASRYLFGLAALALVVLVVNVQTSVSKDSSFAPAWVLAALPMSLVVARSLDAEHAASVGRGFTAIVAVFATISCVRLVLFGERASLPLVDPNNYASLLYLAWIPFVHARIAWAWVQAPSTRERAVEALGSFLFLVALFATQSRTAVVIVAIALGAWFAIGVFKRQRLGPPLVHAAIAGAALATVLLSSPHDLVASRVATVGAGVDVRLDLLRAALHMYVDHPFQGIGVFCFSLLYNAYRPLTEQVTAGLFVHNDYVQLLAEGGWLLAILPLTLAGAAVRALIAGVRSDVRDVAFGRVGTALALAAVCAHASVNFVFYTLALGIAIGVLAARMTGTTGPPPAAPPRALRMGIAVALAFGWVAWLYLGLDLVTVAVFQGQRGVPFSDVVRNDPGRQLAYARLAEKINGERGIPALAQAMLLAASADSAPAQRDALDHFRRAIAIDPWNPLCYIAFAEFLQRGGERLELRDGENPRDLLLMALAVDPTNVVAIDGILDVDRSLGRVGDAYEVLKRVVVPRLELLKRQDEDAANRYLDAAQHLAELAGDRAFAEELERRRSALQRVAPKVYPGWFD